MPTLEEIQAELAKRDIPKITREEINEYNSKPEVRERGARVVTISGDRTKTTIIFILIGFLICAGVFTYLAYTDKLKLFNIDIPDCVGSPVSVNSTCEKQTCTCNNDCPSYNFTCAPQIKVYTNST